MLVNLEELAVVDDETDDVAHVVRLVRAVGYHAVQLLVHPQRIVCRLYSRRRLEVVLRQEREEVPGVLEALVLVVGGEMRDSRFRVVRHRAS